jgi:hypothetical protein
VVRHLEHVRAHVHAAGDDARLRRAAEVTGQQHAHTVAGDPHDERQVVGLGRRRGQLRRRGQHLDDGVPHGAPLARHQHVPFRARAAYGVGQPAGAVVGRGERPGGDHPHRAPRQRTGEATGVVGVEVGDQHQRQAVDAQPVEAAVDRTHLGTGVDQHPLPRSGRHHQGVALPDVAGDHDGVLRRPAPRQLADRPAQHHHADQGRQRQGPRPGEAPQQPARTEQQHRQQHGAPRADRPAQGTVGQGCCPLGHEDQPAHRPPGEPHQRLAQGRDPDGGQRRQQAQHGRRGHGRRGEQVRRQGDRADHAGQRSDQGRGRQPGGCRDGHRVRDRTRPAPVAEPA